VADSPKDGAPDCLAPLEHVHTLGRTDNHDLKAKREMFVNSCPSSITSTLFVTLPLSLTHSCVCENSSLQMRYKAAMRGETKLGIALDT